MGVQKYEQDGWLRQDDEFSDDELDRFDAGSARQRPENPYAAAIGVGAGVRIGAGAAAGGAGAKAGGGDQQAFVAALMFRRGRVSEEEASAHPALRALSAYRAVACGDGEGEDGGGGGGMARFPVPVVEALVEKPRCVCVCCVSVFWGVGGKMCDWSCVVYEFFFKSARGLERCSLDVLCCNGK